MLSSNNFSWKPLNFKQRIGAPGYFGRTDGCMFCSESPQEMQWAHVSMRTQNWYEEILWFVSFNTSASLFKFFLKLLHLWELEALLRKSCKNLQAHIAQTYWKILRLWYTEAPRWFHKDD